MTKAGMRKVKGLVAGMVAGTTVSFIAANVMKPKPAKMLRKKAAKALDAVGAVMQNIADYTR